MIKAIVGVEVTTIQNLMNIVQNGHLSIFLSNNIFLQDGDLYLLFTYFKRLLITSSCPKNIFCSLNLYLSMLSISPYITVGKNREYPYIK